MNIEGKTVARSPVSAYFIGNTLLVLAAALLGSFLIQSIHPVFQVPEEFHIVSMGASVEKTEALIRQQIRTDRLNALLELSAVGGLLGMAFACGRSGCCSLWLRTLAAFPSGVLAGALAAWIGIQVQSRIKSSDLPSVVDTVQIQTAMLFTLGLGLGVIRSVLVGPAGGRVRTAIGTAFTGGLAGAMFAVIAAIGFPASGTEALVPVGATLNVLWVVTIAVGLALGLTVGHAPPKNLIDAALPDAPVAGA